MNIVIDKIITYIILIYCTIIELGAYSKISSKKFSFNSNKLIIILMTFIQFCTNYYINTWVKVIISFLILYFLFKLIFKENIKNTLIKTLFIYFLITSIELILSFLVIYVRFLNFTNLNLKTIIFKNIFTIILISIVQIIFNIKGLTKNINKLIKILVKDNLVILKVILFIINLFALIILMKFAVKINQTNYFLNILFLFIVSVLYFILLENCVKIEKMNEHQKILFEYISKYEKLIDKDNINQHEILNNLLILKSYKNKNSKEFNDYLDEMIFKFDNSEKEKLKNITKLPTGIKGIFYYKIYDVEKYNINLTFYYSKKLDNIWKYIGNRDYTRLCEIIGILLDNSIEASKKSKDKLLTIDIFKEKNFLNLFIENSIDKKVNIQNAKKKYFSTKGKTRGLGLYIAYKLESKSRNIKINQKIVKNKFISEVKVKIK